MCSLNQACLGKACGKPMSTFVGWRMAQTIDACDVSPTYDKSQFLGHSETANRWDISNISVIFKFFFQDAYGHNFLFSLNHVKKNNNDMTFS